VKALANKINDMFLSVTENFSPLPQQNETIQVPVELLATVQEVQFSLIKEYQTFQVSRSRQLTKQGAKGVCAGISHSYTRHL
jgi:hypothetical protein